MSRLPLHDVPSDYAEIKHLVLTQDRLLLWLNIPIVSIALVFYGAGIGLESIARGTLPLAIFGAARYPVVMGRIARPSLIAQAVAPTIAAGLIEIIGIDGMLATLVLIAIGNAALTGALFLLLRIGSARQAATP